MRDAQIGTEVARSGPPVVRENIRPKSDDVLSADAAEPGGPSASQLGALEKGALLWRSLSFARRVGIAALIAHALLIALSGQWLCDRIMQNVLQDSARSGAIFMEGFIGPHVQELAREANLSPQSAAAINELLSRPPLKGHLVELRLWRRDGSEIYDSEGEASYIAPPVMDEIDQVFRGSLTVELNDAHHDQASLERKHRMPLFEVNAPLHELGTRRVIAVAEFYLAADKLHTDLEKARWQSWLVVGSLALALLLPLYPMILSGSRQIDEQRAALTEEQAEQRRLSEQNQVLKGGIEQAHRRGAEINERSMRRIGADLHDGPAQLVGLALLKLDDLVPVVKTAENGAERHLDTLNLVRQALTDALREIRNVASGLALPELERVSLAAALELAIRSHEQRTRTAVSSNIGELPAHLPLPITICLFRFAQECLNNAYRHAGGKGQLLRAGVENGDIVVEVSDAGPGIEPMSGEGAPGKLGLAGLKDRVETLGGRFEIRSLPGKGTIVTARFVPSLTLKPNLNG